ncbi:Protein Disulfide-Isomerase A3 [Manis pentadactyla]|nr:Protein Disulfide-Isomerase A3 [Manis pentadactyla]
METGHNSFSKLSWSTCHGQALFPNTLPLGTRHPRACCYWYAISEMQNNLTINSESSDFNQRHILKVRAQTEGPRSPRSDCTLLLGPALGWGDLGTRPFSSLTWLLSGESQEKFNVSTASPTISKNLEGLEKLLGTLPIPTPTSQGEELILARDFHEFSKKLNVFLKTLDDTLKSLLRCPETLKLHLC